MSDRANLYYQGIHDWVINLVGDDAAPTEKGSVFCQWVLENVFEISSDDALDAQVMSGSRDHSIDGLIEDEDNILVIQTKFDSAHDYSEMTKFHYDMCRIRDGKSISDELANDDAQRAIARIRDAYAIGLDIKYYYVTNARFTLIEQTKMQEFSGYNQEFNFWGLNEIAQRLDSRQDDIPFSIKGKWFGLPLSTHNILTANSTAVIAVSLKDIYQFVATCGNDLFASNVRQYLHKTKINRGIQDTILDAPDDFWIFNNGITIVCDDYQEENFTFQLQTPQIVNGCQTARSIWEVFSKKTSDDRELIKGQVLVRIIKDPDEKKRDLIERWS